MKEFEPWTGHEDTVVCVDDEPPILKALQRLLRNEPIRLFTTTDPKQALDWVRGYAVGVVIADYRMPKVNGVEFLKVVRAASPATSRILLTGYREDTPIMEHFKDGLMRVLLKPWDDEGLKRLIREELAVAAGRRSSADTPRP